jgi:hypothetical protein
MSLLVQRWSNYTIAGRNAIPNVNSTPAENELPMDHRAVPVFGIFASLRHATGFESALNPPEGGGNKPVRLVWLKINT